jgi:chorismate mutase/prephenate dehydratase
VENSTEGVVNHTLDMFIESELKICAEVYLRISHFLLAKSPLSEIKRVYSHPQALAQSRRWLLEHLPHTDLVEVASTARAAAMAALEPGSAAVAPQLAAQVYGLNILASHIEERASNVTRFLVIGHSTGERSGNDKTAVMFSLQDRVGALHDALAAFKDNNINLTMIESRPSRTRAWDWIFFAEFTGHPDDDDVRRVLTCLRAGCGYLKVLGAWPIEMGA